MPDDLTPDALAELQRLLDEVRDGSPLPWRRIGSRVDSADRFKVAECLLDEDARLIVAAVNALPALPDAAALLDEVRGQVARGALCPMCSTGMTRQTVGVVCQLCGTDYARPEYASLRRDAEQTTKRDALAAKVERVRALHFGEYVEDEDRNRCFECGDDWPCPTARALDGGES